jgi:hypothetical protein
MILLRTSQSSAKSFCAFLWLKSFCAFCGDKKPGVERNPRLNADDARGARQPAKL